MGQLIDGVLADAKEVKKMAYANARQTILETFQPQVQRLVSSRIAEEEGEEEMDIDVDINLPTDDPAVGFGGAEEEEPAPEGEEDEEMELEALIRELEGEDEYMDESDGEDEYMDESEGEDDEFSDSEITEILRELEGEEEYMDESEDDDELMESESDYEVETPVRQMNTESRNRQIRKLQKDLRESYQAITILKKTINEVNLLNAKLMYSQRIAHKIELSENQRIKILEAFDRATSVREVKSKYLDIMTLMNKSQKKATPKTRVTEGAASRPGKQISPKKPLNETYEFASRWKQLAGMAPLDY